MCRKIFFCVTEDYCCNTSLHTFFFTFFKWLSVRLKVTKLSSENSYCNEQSALVLKESEAQDTFLKYLLCQSKWHIFFWIFFINRSERICVSVSYFMLIWITPDKSQLEEGEEMGFVVFGFLRFILNILKNRSFSGNRQCLYV